MRQHFKIEKPSWQTVVALVAYLSVFVSGVIFLVMLIEFDPEGAEAYSQGAYCEARAVEQQGTWYADCEGKLYMLPRASETTNLLEGQLVMGYRTLDDTSMLLLHHMPDQPRGYTPLIITLVGLLISMALVGFDLRVAYCNASLYD